MKMYTILDTIQEIIERADEAKNNLKANGHDEREYGRLYALCEVLSIIKTDFMGEDEVENMLNFDIDKKYLL